MELSTAIPPICILEEMKSQALTLQFCVFNAENLFLLSDTPLSREHTQLKELDWQALSTSIHANKPLSKLFDLQQLILKRNPDILLLCEVGGLESLQNFNRLFLKSQYHVALIEGNSDRNIDLGFLIRKSLPIYFDLHSNKSRPISYVSISEPTKPQFFSRDVAELHLFHKVKEAPFLILLLTHLKSRLDPERIDPGGSDRRGAELLSLLGIYHEIHDDKFLGKVPMIVAGDFNGEAGPAKPDPEFSLLYQNTELEDICALSGLSEVDRATFYQVGRSRTLGRQLDYAFLSPKAKSTLQKDSVFVHRYTLPNGLPMDPPRSMAQKMTLPSDHYPLFFTLKDLPLDPLNSDG